MIEEPKELKESSSPILENTISTIDRLLYHSGSIELIFDFQNPGGCLHPEMLNRELGGDIICYGLYKTKGQR